MKRFLSLLAAVLLAQALACPALADGSVTYDGGAEEFIFAPGTKQSPTSLFEDFLDMMPGDERTERIEIRNARRSGEAVRVYMRSLGAQEDTDAFLAQFTLTVRPAEDSPLFEAPANETAQLSDWVCLGTIQPGGNIPLDVTLAMPVTAGNEWQSRIGYIDWQFKIERIPAAAEAAGTPGTGDAAHPGLYLTAVSLAALGIVFARRKAKN